jgi:UDP-glucose 4-epimerase
MTRVLVTGAAGFIGSHLCEALLGRGVRDLIAFDNFSRGRIENLGKCRSHITLIEGDVRDRVTLERLTGDCDLVYHLAAQSSVMTSEDNREASISSNVTGTYNVLAAAEKARVGRVVFTSSREVYGDPDMLPVPESAPLAPKNMYGATKVAGEAMCGAFRHGGLNIQILRLSNVYGPRDRDRVIPLFIDNALNGRVLTLYGGEQVLDFVWVGVVVDALLKVGFGDVTQETLNVGGGIGTPIKRLADRVLSITSSCSPMNTLPSRSPEVTRFVADIRRARRVLKMKFPEDPLCHLADVVRSMQDSRTVTNSVAKGPFVRSRRSSRRRAPSSCRIAGDWSASPKR